MSYADVQTAEEEFFCFLNPSGNKFELYYCDLKVRILASKVNGSEMFIDIGEAYSS